MQRRKFLIDSITGLPVILLSPNLLMACSDDDGGNKAPNGKTVIVIGAGISGLAAAKKLQQEGFTVIVLEAQEKVGGRLRTDRSLGIAFDEGASWIHGPRRNPITDLASESGANTFLTDDDSVEVYDINGSQYDDRTLTSAEERYEEILEEVIEAGNENQSFETIFNTLYPTLGNYRLWKCMLSAYLEFSLGGDISKLSSLYFYDDEEFNGADLIITNGYDNIANHLAVGLDLRLNTRVSDINYGEEKVMIRTQGETFEGDYVLVTLPLGVLKSNTVSFSPALPDTKSMAISKTNMGNVNKFLLVWDDAFWDTDLQYLGYTPDIKGKFNYFLNLNTFSSANALMTFAFGEYATETESMSDPQIIDEIMIHLKNMYGENIPNPTSMLRTKWGQNIHSFGAYSYATNGTTSEDFDTLAASVDDKVFFAGEHTSRDYRGTVHGAYLSGIREAEKIINL